ncbi:hypothetical protein ACP70R_007448 [Stipagrostis hirtigluma subsp. patula]
MDSAIGASGEALDEMPPRSSDQETPRRWSLAALGSGDDAGGERGARRKVPGEADRAVAGVAVGWHSAGHPGRRAPLSSLPRRPRQRAVGVPPVACHSARPRPASPLPLLVLPEFKFSSLSPKGTFTPVRRVPVPKGVAADDLRCVGSCDGWLVGVTPSKNRSDEYYRDSDSGCFLVNVFSREVVGLPELSNSRYNFSAYSSKTLRVINGSGEVHFGVNDVYTLSLSQVVLSASPDSGCKYIVAAFSYHKGAPQLALWQPGMNSWHLCTGVGIDGPNDLTFYQGKLYLLQRCLACLFTLELEEDDRGVVVSCVEQCMTEPLFHQPIRYDDRMRMRCNMVVWRGKLLLILRYCDSYLARCPARRVEVFALDFSTNPYGLTEIHSLDGDCIFVGADGCKSFPAGLHDGVEGDLIYVVPDFWNPFDQFVYNVRDGKLRPFAVKILSCNFDVAQDYLDFPVWLFPSE